MVDLCSNYEGYRLFNSLRLKYPPALTYFKLCMRES